MKSLIVVIIAALLICSCQEKPTESDSIASYTIEQFMDTEEIFGSSFSPDESKIMINSKKSGVYNAIEIDIATGEQKVLTQSDSSAIFSRSYFPNDDRFVFTSDQNGNELTHIYIQNENGGTTDLTPDSAKAAYYGWNVDKTAIYWGSNKRDPRYFDLYKTEVNKSVDEGVLQTTTIFESTDGLSTDAMSDDENYIALLENITTSNSNIYLLNTATGERKLITKHEGTVSNSSQYFSKDNTKLFYLTDEGAEFTYLMSYDIATGEKMIEETADWDIMYVYLSETGKYRVTAINNDASTEIKILDTETGNLLDLPNIPEGDITSVNISDSEQLMSFYLSSSKSPNNLYVYNLDTKEMKKLTNTTNPEINQNDLVAGDVIRFESYDGLEIPAILYTPKYAGEGDNLPALLYIHGGPGGQTRLNYTSRIQYWVNNGYVVLAVNNRGSSGYGKTFYKMDDQKHGDVDLRDCIASKKFLIETGYVDPDKIGIMGGSYGGYMVMAALTFAPEEFTVGVNYFGVTNWLRTLKSIPPWWESFREALYEEMGNPETDSAALYNKSPLFFADQITKPFIVLQGSNDPRVLKVESDEIVEAAKANGVPVEYVIFDDEGHGFVKKENNITASKEVVKFLDKYLKGEPKPSESTPNKESNS